MLHHWTYQQRIHQLSVIHPQPNQHPGPRKSQRLSLWKSQRLLLWKCQRLFLWKSQRLLLWKCQRLLLCPPVLRATPGMFMAPSTVSLCLPLAPPPSLMALQRSMELLERVVLSSTALGSGEVSATTDSATSRVATKRTPLKSILST